jgi:hypothetical protein
MITRHARKLHNRHNYMIIANKDNVSMTKQNIDRSHLGTSTSPPCITDHQTPICRLRLFFLRRSFQERLSSRDVLSSSIIFRKPFSSNGSLRFVFLRSLFFLRSVVIVTSSTHSIRVQIVCQGQASGESQHRHEATRIMFSLDLRDYLDTILQRRHQRGIENWFNLQGIQTS